MGCVSKMVRFTNWFKVAVFLASDDAAWITGEQISVSGGMYGF